MKYKCWKFLIDEIHFFYRASWCMIYVSAINNMAVYYSCFLSVWKKYLECIYLLLDIFFVHRKMNTIWTFFKAIEDMGSLFHGDDEVWNHMMCIIVHIHIMLYNVHDHRPMPFSEKLMMYITLGMLLIDKFLMQHIKHIY